MTTIELSLSRHGADQSNNLIQTIQTMHADDTERGSPSAWGTTIANHWNVCIQHLTSILCKHQSNLD